MKAFIKQILRGRGIDLVSFDPVNHPIARRLKLIMQYKIDLLFDVGANTGQYANQMRLLGYHGKIVSFEPLSAAYKELEKRARPDPLWDTVNIALGNENSSAEINIAQNSQSSSILGILPAHVNVAPESVYVGKENIIVRRLDTIIDDYWLPSQNLFVKIDAQGYERHILEGMGNSLDRVVGVQMEVSLVPLYEGETLLPDMITLMASKGYVLMSVEPTYGNAMTGQLLQIDCIFFRQNVH